MGQNQSENINNHDNTNHSPANNNIIHDANNVNILIIIKWTLMIVIIFAIITGRRGAHSGVSRVSVMVGFNTRQNTTAESKAAEAPSWVDV